MLGSKNESIRIFFLYEYPSYDSPDLTPFGLAHSSTSSTGLAGRIYGFKDGTLEMKLVELAEAQGNAGKYP